MYLIYIWHRYCRENRTTEYQSIEPKKSSSPRLELWFRQKILAFPVHQGFQERVEMTTQFVASDGWGVEELPAPTAGLLEH